MRSKQLLRIIMILIAGFCLTFNANADDDKGKKPDAAPAGDSDEAAPAPEPDPVTLDIDGKPLDPKENLILYACEWPGGGCLSDKIMEDERIHAAAVRRCLNIQTTCPHFYDESRRKYVRFLDENVKDDSAMQLYIDHDDADKCDEDEVEEVKTADRVAIDSDGVWWYCLPELGDEDDRVQISKKRTAPKPKAKKKKAKEAKGEAKKDDGAKKPAAAKKGTDPTAAAAPDPAMSTAP